MNRRQFLIGASTAAAVAASGAAGLAVGRAATRKTTDPEIEALRAEVIRLKGLLRESERKRMHEVSRHAWEESQRAREP